MRRLFERLRRPWSACCGALLLAGCVTPPPSAPLAPPAQEKLLRDLAGFELQGKAGAVAGQQSFAATLSWNQQADESRLQLGGLLGGGLRLSFGPQSLRVNTGDDEFRDADAAQILSAQLGFVPPFAALRYWVLGLVAPGEPPQDSASDSSGRMATLVQQGWHLQYERWTDVATRAGTVWLPQKVTATRADVRLTLVVSRWELQVGN